MAGSNRRPPRYKHVALPTELMELIQVSNKIIINSDFFKGLLWETLNAEGGIRTHEAVAVELKSTPFDRSGTSAECIYIYYKIVSIMLHTGLEPMTCAS